MNILNISLPDLIPTIRKKPTSYWGRLCFFFSSLVLTNYAHSQINIIHEHNENPILFNPQQYSVNSLTYTYDNSSIPSGNRVNIVNISYNGQKDTLLKNEKITSNPGLTAVIHNNTPHMLTTRNGRFVLYNYSGNTLNLIDSSYTLPSNLNSYNFIENSLMVIINIGNTRKIIEFVGNSWNEINFDFFNNNQNLEIINFSVNSEGKFLLAKEKNTTTGMIKQLQIYQFSNNTWLPYFEKYEPINESPFSSIYKLYMNGLTPYISYLKNFGQVPGVLRNLTSSWVSLCSFDSSQLPVLSFDGGGARIVTSSGWQNSTSKLQYYTYNPAGLSCIHKIIDFSTTCQSSNYYYIRQVLSKNLIDYIVTSKFIIRNEVNIDDHSSETVCHFKFDGDLYDSSGNNYLGESTGTTFVADRFGVPNKALSFDNTNTISKVLVKSADRKLSLLSKEFSVMFHFKTSNNTGSFLSKMSSNAPAGYSVTPISFELRNHNCQFDQEINLPTTINDNIWHCLSIVKSEQDSLFLYLDGNLKNKKLLSNFENFNYYYNPNDLVIGMGYKGIIDDLKIFSYAINPNNMTEYCSNIFVNTSNISEKMTFEVSPNPTKNILMIKTKFDDIGKSYFELFNSCGQLVSNGNITSNEHILDIAQFNSGLYFLKISNPKKISTIKIIIE